MQWLNYHHLLYFWTVARTGSVTAAGVELRLSPATISAQVHELEDCLGEKLFRRSGRRLQLTEAGTRAFRYASEIFALGRELVSTRHDGMGAGPLRLVIGVADVLPSFIAKWLIAPALALPQPVRIVCREAATEQLLARLATQEIDLVLSDAAVSSTRIRAYNRRIAQCGVSFVGAAELATPRRKKFPRSLDGAPMLLPTENTAIRRSLDAWFAGHGIRPDVIGEFEDYSLLRACGEAGLGIFPAPDVLQHRIETLFSLHRLGHSNEISYHFFAVSAEKKTNHPAVTAICADRHARSFINAHQGSR